MTNNVPKLITDFTGGKNFPMHMQTDENNNCLFCGQALSCARIERCLGGSANRG